MHSSPIHVSWITWYSLCSIARQNIVFLAVVLKARGCTEIVWWKSVKVFCVNLYSSFQPSKTYFLNSNPLKWDLKEIPFRCLRCFWEQVSIGIIMKVCKFLRFVSIFNWLFKGEQNIFLLHWDLSYYQNCSNSFSVQTPSLYGFHVRPH